MLRQSFTLALLAILLSCAPLFAHDEFRVVGTVTGLRNSQLQVKSTDGKNVSVKLTAETYIHRDKEEAKVPPTELKVGTSVVVDGLGDDITVLDGLEIRIVPSIPQSGSK